MARLVPSLTSSQRPSKVHIVNDTIRHLQQQRDMCIAAGHDMQDLLAENERLRSEINALRLQTGVSAIPLERRPVSEAMSQLMQIGQESYEAPSSGSISAGSNDSPEYYAPSRSEISAEMPLLYPGHSPSCLNQPFESMLAPYSNTSGTTGVPLEPSAFVPETSTFAGSMEPARSSASMQHLPQTSVFGHIEPHMQSQYADAGIGLDWFEPVMQSGLVAQRGDGMYGQYFQHS